ncbi:MAG: glycosyltransferase family 39 protein [Burkholderiales bacterium]|nr:glycosyltransferase family 39 protein [Burkholderiales bacterium]
MSRAAFAPRHAFWAAAAATLAFRFWLSTAAPVTADEAYFALWGRHPAAGYYDHPPMIGWWLALLLSISEATWVLRLPATLAPLGAALFVRAALARGLGLDAGRANLAGLCVLLVPMNVWNVLVTTDAPLMLFAAASALAFALAAQRQARAQPGARALFFAAGALLGLAFLSKYLAVLLGLGFLAWAASTGRWAGLALAAAGAAPAALYNLWWNANACWANVMFNAVNRHLDDGGWSLATPALYALSLAYLAAPLLWLAWRGRAQLAAAWGRPEVRALVLAWLVPFGVFAALAPVKRIGLHWLLAFLPALAASVALVFERAALERAVRVLAAFALFHVAAAFALAALPLELWSGTRLYRGLVFLVEAPALAARAPAPGAALAADSYSAAAILAWHAGRDVPVFGAGSSHARHDDILTDWRRYDGADLTVLRREPPREEDYRRYFRALEVRVLEARGVRFFAVTGRGFDYAAYRRGVLEEVRRRYYRIPAWLPVRGCYFFERYFPQ